MTDREDMDTTALFERAMRASKEASEDIADVQARIEELIDENNRLRTTHEAMMRVLKHYRSQEGGAILDKVFAEVETLVAETT